MAICDGRGFQLALSWLIMAALCGLIGFAVIYHYASFVRPVQSFAIVIDAGSTQTRSSLFTITHNVPDSTDKELNSLDELISVQQVSSCTNGGPVSGLKSEMGARQLVGKCLSKFAKQIKKLDFIKQQQVDNEEDEDEDPPQGLDDLDDQLTLMNHRVNSVTHLYLGATAGMRALAQLNETRAREKINWIDNALEKGRNQVTDLPYINKGYVGIIEGSEEAAFGWISVNFICKNLPLAAPRQLLPSLNHYTQAGGSIEFGPSELERRKAILKSVGTLELGGASAQMAYQVDDQMPDEQIRIIGLDGQTLQLFENKFHLATRSDLCLGMSQAVFRNHYVLLRNLYTSLSTQAADTIELENPCLQRAARVSLTGQEMANILRRACLAPSDSDPLGPAARNYSSTLKTITYLGTGDVSKCERFLNNLLEPQLCRGYFSLCPDQRNTQPPPRNMSFVTISGYNKALQVLNLQKATEPDTSSSDELIKQKLGGYPVNYNELIDKTNKFCAIDASEFPMRFPNMRSSFYSITCMQLIYIKKMITEFYQFEPTTSWGQIKFLLFPLKPSSNVEDNFVKKTKTAHDDKADIGWALGLVLNATSEQASQGSTGNNDIVHHHGATIMFILTSTLFLMFACVLLATSLIIFIIVSVKYHRGSQAISTRYLDPPPYYGANA